MLTSLFRFNILPSNSIQEVGYGGVANTKHASEPTLAITLCKHTLDVGRVCLGQFCNATAAGVLCLRHWLQVVGIYAQTILAKVVKRQSRWYGAVFLFIVETVWRVSVAVNPDTFGIALWRLTALPNPTARIGVNNILYWTQGLPIRMMPRKVANWMARSCTPCILIAPCKRGGLSASTHTQASWIGRLRDVRGKLLAPLQFFVHRVRGNLVESVIPSIAHGFQCASTNQEKHICIGYSENWGHFFWSHRMFASTLLGLRRLYHRCAMRANQEAALYNAGAGLTYASFTL